MNQKSLPPNDRAASEPATPATTAKPAARPAQSGSAARKPAGGGRARCTGSSSRGATPEAGGGPQEPSAAQLSQSQSL